MQNHLFVAAILLFSTTSPLLADKEAPALQGEVATPSTEPTKDEWKLEPKISEPERKQFEEIRKQLGPEFSIESKEFGIERERPASTPHLDEQNGDECQGTKLYEQVRELVNRFRENARHLEELAGEAEQLSEYGLADQLREMARHQWEHARELSKPRSTQPYRDPWQPTLPPTYAAPPAAASPNWAPIEYRPPANNSPAETAPAYGPPATPSQRFSVPGKSKPQTR